MDFVSYLKGLDATSATDDSLWKAIKNLKCPVPNQPRLRRENNEWPASDAEKAVTLAEHLRCVSVPNAEISALKRKKCRLFYNNATPNLNLLSLLPKKLHITAKRHLATT